MHCDDPACRSVCPSDAIARDAHGVVQTALAERCIGCGNCVLACPFGVPRLDERAELMRKCDLCHDRTSRGDDPMCATVCPSGALFYGTRAEIEARRRARPTNLFQVGDAVVRTRVQLLVPDATMLVALDEHSRPRTRAEVCLEEAII
jgi:Fe-S-cluster-containing dehydrogenase component